MFTRKRIVIALGGNALGNTLPEQMVAVSNCFRIPSRRPKYNRLRPKQPCIHFHWNKKFPER